MERIGFENRLIDDPFDSKYMMTEDFDWEQPVSNLNFPVDNYDQQPINIEDILLKDKAKFKSEPTLAQLNLTEDLLDSLDFNDPIDNDSFDPRNSICISKMINSLRNNNGNLTFALNDDFLTYLNSESSQYQLNLTHSIINSMEQENSINDNIINESESKNTQMELIEASPETETYVKSDESDNENDDEDDNEDIVEMPESKAELILNSSVPAPAGETRRSTRIRNSSMSTDCSFSSHDEGFASQQDDSENDDGMSSDDESFYGDYDAKDLIGATTSDDTENKWALNVGRSRKTGQQRYFWQYNVQSKGPKGTRIITVPDKCNDPHVLTEAKDPVFSPDCHVEGVKHAGKARRGDGNDLTPNPKKLLMIGLELKKLTKIITDLTPVAQVPINSRNKSRKEKNKLASRACRLKKKAQHEANKIKLFGLHQEHKKMMSVLLEIREVAKETINHRRHEGKLKDICLEILNQKGPVTEVAGRTSDFVNCVLDNVSAGSCDGGLDKL